MFFLACFVPYCELAMYQLLEKAEWQACSKQESIVDGNHQVVYAMKNKSLRIIETFLIICNFAARVMHMKGLLLNKLALWKLANPYSAAGLPDENALPDCLVDLASSVSKNVQTARVEN